MRNHFDLNMHDSGTCANCVRTDFNFEDVAGQFRPKLPGVHSRAHQLDIPDHFGATFILFVSLLVANSFGQKLPESLQSAQV